MVDFTNIDFDQLFGFSDDSNPLLMLVWILPIILFVFYGQRIQLQVTSGEIKKGIKKLDAYRIDARTELIEYVKKNMNPKEDPTKKIDRFLDYFTIMPVDMDPNGIVDKVRHTVRAREDYSRNHVKSISPGIDEIELSKIFDCKKAKQLSFNFTTSNDFAFYYGRSRSHNKSYSCF
jgi:hypothetical protein